MLCYLVILSLLFQASYSLKRINIRSKSDISFRFPVSTNAISPSLSVVLTKASSAAISGGLLSGGLHAITGLVRLLLSTLTQI